MKWLMILWLVLLLGRLVAEEEVYYLHDNEWVTVSAGLGGGITVDIPAGWQSREHTPDMGFDPFYQLVVYGDGISISFHESPISRPSMILDGFDYYGRFLFDDGHVGYWGKRDDLFVWIHYAWGILDVYLWHEGNKGLFVDNEYVILRIVRSLRYVG